MNFKKLSKRILSLLIVAVMLVGVASPVISAAGYIDHMHKDVAGDSKLHYVSLGASNTNGYGHHGYLDEEIYEDPLAANKSQMNDYGYDKAPENAYPALIRDALEESTGREVELHQLAISSMRVEEVLWLLDDTFTPDEYMNWRFTGGKSWFDMAHKEGGREALRVEYREYIAEADVITVDLGWNNFGVYAFNNIMTILKDNRFWKAPDFEKVVSAGQEKEYYAIRDRVVKALSEKMTVDGTALDGKIEMLADVLAYAAFGACYNFDKVMGNIYELNPDAKVVVINIQNLADELNLNLNGKEIPLGDLYGELIEFVDFYRATMSPYANRYSFAYAGEDGDVDTFLDEFRLWDGDPATLSQDMKDLFDMYDDNLYVRSKIEYIMIGEVLSSLFDTFRKLGASYGLSVFNNDDKYVYEFALDMSWLNGIDLSSLDFNNPDTPLEEYGAALSKHLVNLRNYEGDGKYAYDYVFENLIQSLTYQKTQVTIQKSNAEIERAGLVAQKDVLIEKKAELEAQLEITSDPASKAELEAAIANYENYITQYNDGIAQYDEGIAQAEAGIAQLEDAIANVIPVAKQGFDNTYAGIYSVYVNTLNYAYDTVATIIQYSLQFNTFYITSDSMANHNSKTDELLNYVVGTFTANTELKFKEELRKIGLYNEEAVAPEIIVDTELFEDPLIQAVAALEVRYDFGNSFFAHPSVKGNKQICAAVMNALKNGSDADAFADEKLEEYIGMLEENLNGYYEEKRNELVQNGTIDEIFGVLDRIENSMDSFEEDIHGFDVPDNIGVDSEREDNVKNLMVEEINNIRETIDVIRDILGTENVTFDAEAWSKVVKAQRNLENHTETLGSLGLEIGFVADDYIADVWVVVEIQNDIAEDVVNEGYAYLLETVEDFGEGYLEFVQLVGAYTDNIAPELGSAVRDYLIDTPAEAINIIAVYGEEAVLKFIVDASAAANDLYLSVSAIVAILVEHGGGIYNEVVADEDYKALVEAIELKVGDLAKLYKKAQETPILTVLELEETIAEESEDIAALYSQFVALVMKNVEAYDDEVAELLWAALTDTAEAIGVFAQGGEDYLAWLGNHSDAMLGELLRSFIENSYELGETADAVIWNYLNVLDTFLSDTYDKVNAQICMQIAVIRAKLEGIVGEKAAQLEAKLAELEAKLEKLITMLNKGIGDVKALVSEIEKLIAEIKALAELLDGIDIGACLNKIVYAVEFIYSMNSDELKSALNELALDLFDRAMESLKESAPYIDEKLYEYFYNNPEQIIDFFKTYGPEIEKYADKYSDKILSVFGYVLYEYGYDALVYFIENPEETLRNISLWYDEYGVRIWPLVQVYIDALGIDYYALEGIDVDFEDVVERLYALIVRIDSDLTELIVKLEVLGVKLNEGAARALELIAEIKSKIEYLVTVGRDHAEATLDEIKMMAELINTYSSELQLAIKEIIDNTVNGEYTPDEDSYYVAIAGDNNGYAELVAGAMGLGDKYVVMNWNNIDYSILEGADFVTIGYDATAVSGFAIDQLLAALAAYGSESLKGQLVDYLNSAFADNLSEEQIAEYTSLVVNAMDTVLEHPAFAGGQTVTMDWASLVGAENVAEIEALLAEVKALLEEKGIDGNVVVPINVAELVDKYVPQNGFAITVFDNKPVFELSVPAADLIMLAVESYLYANISFQMSYATLIGELVAINPDVQIAVLGQYNPFCDLTIEGITIPVSEIYESLVNVRSAVSFVYALGLSNVTYIDISNVEAEWITVENPADILDAYADNELNASFTDAGNLYVMYQILNAYSLSCQHVYDGCEDVDCNICGDIRESSKHNYVAVVIKPDCENGGYTAYTCSNCGDSYVDDEVAALGHAYDNDCDADCNRCSEKRTPADHKFGDWKTTVPATEDTAGERARTCLVCGYVETEIISPTPIEPIGVGAVVAIVIGSLVCVSGITAAVLLILKKRKIS